ncbi:MAG TPA: hypothetical protein VMT16_15560 [Thermoanaerobaculia bacterium]|nr:hypothetical protein [Thermoanaerobaculia bacterium]
MRLSKTLLSTGLAVLFAAPLAAAEAAQAPPPADQWWQGLSQHCGRAYVGWLASDDAADAIFAERRLVMHVRACAERRIEIPFHVGEDRSRTWVLTRTAEGIQLEHDHRHEDGSADEITMYGGHTAGPGTAAIQSFPADERSRALFRAHDIPQSADNVWTMELVPGESFSYLLRRPARYLRIDFDLSQPVDPPPPPWGHE